MTSESDPRRRFSLFDSPVYRVVAVALLAGLFGCNLTYGQADYSTGTLRGTVIDPTGAVVPNASVTATNPATNIAKSTKTGNDGSYQIPLLNPGAYQIEVEAQGFSKAVAKDVALTVGQTVVYDVHLVVGTVGTTVEVTTEAPLIQTEQTQQANTVNNLQVENLPNVTRNFTQSIYTLPGVINSFAPAAQDPGVGTGYQSSGFSIGGSNGRNNLFTIDGGENDYGSGSLRVRHVPLDSIQEFQVNRNSAAAEFGFTVGTAINMITKSGANKYHGSAYGYFHDHATDAVNFFNRFAPDPTVKPFEQSLISGGSLGGALKKDKLFFFTSYEHQKLDDFQLVNLLGTAEFQPLSAQPNGYDAASKRCPSQSNGAVSQACYLTQLASSGGPLAALGQGLMASPVFSPLSNPILNSLVTADNGLFNGNAGPAGSIVDADPTENGRLHNWVTRMDYIPGTNDTISVRFGFTRESYAVTGPGGVPRQTSNALLRRDYSPIGTWTHVFTPEVVNVFRFQFVHDTAPAVTPQASGSEIDLNAGSGVVLGRPFAYPYNATEKRFQFDDSVSWIKGSHSLKFGGSYRPVSYNVFEQLWFGGQFQFFEGAIPLISIVPPALQPSLAAYNASQGYPLEGPPTTNLTAAQSYVAGLPGFFLGANNNGNWSGWAHYLGIYAQDSWKVTPGLTVNYGVRLDYDNEPTPVPQSVYISPRLGIAWDPTGDHKTVIRAGGGIYVSPTLFLVPFYTNLLGDSGKYINQGGLALAPPADVRILGLWAAVQSRATVANPNPAVTAADLAAVGASIGPPGPTAFGNAIFTLGQNYKPQYAIQASFSIDREIARDLSLELGYNMYRNVHIEQNVESNYVQVPGAPIDPFIGPLYEPRPGTTGGQPNAFILQNNAFSSVGTSTYHGLIVSLTKRYSHGLQFQANYTFSKAIDDTSDFSSLSTPFRPDKLNLDRSVSFFNITHNFVANAVYTTPFHAGTGSVWSSILADIAISPILYAHSGLPFSLLVPGLSNGTVGHNATARPWYEGRNTSVGPNFISWDMRMSKSFYIRRESGLKLDLIAQGTNLLNRTNFIVVNNDFPADPNFALPNGGNLLHGPYNVSGFVPASAAQLSQPLAFSAAAPPRQISLGLQFAF